MSPNNETEMAELSQKTYASTLGNLMHVHYDLFTRQRISNGINKLVYGKSKESALEYD